MWTYKMVYERRAANAQTTTPAKIIGLKCFITCVLLLIAVALPRSVLAVPRVPGSIELGAFRQRGNSGEMDDQIRGRRQRRQESALLLMIG